MFPLTFQHRAGVSPYTSACALAETCVFGKQSPGPIHCGWIAPPPLIPKLRGNFAEFLNHSYLAHLRILFLTTCVGSRYRFQYDKFRSFSRKHGVTRLRFPRKSTSSRFSINSVTDLLMHKPLRLNPNPIMGSCYPSPSLHHS